MNKDYLKTWVGISKGSIAHNFQIFRSLASDRAKIWAVVKSNAYGHGLVVFSKIADQIGVDGFCVDSVREGQKLREAGIYKPVLVLGPTLPALLKEAVSNDLTITISNIDALKFYLKSDHKPNFHLKIDSGMHRQGFYPEDIKSIIPTLKKIKEKFKGTYTHFCSAKDINYPTYTEMQFKKFGDALTDLKKAGFDNLTKHAASTGGALINKKYHLDAIRIGIGLYGLWPSKELNVQLPKIKLEPVLSWHALISETKKIKKGEFIGYDLTERALKNTLSAILPIGYWHGFPRALSSIGKILINGKQARVLGRVAMDLIVVDASNIKCKVGDRATIIGKDQKETIFASDAAAQIGASHYELITRINPLIERIVV